MNLLTRVASLLLLLMALFLATRATIRALPGDPLEAVIAETGTTIPPEVLRSELGLDRPFLLSALDDLRSAFQGDFGTSLASRNPIAPDLARRFRNTLMLTTTALLLAAGFSLWLGLAAAARPGSWADRFCTLHGAISAAVPTAWSGPIWILLLAVWIPIFPIGGHIGLPALALAVSVSGLWARLVRVRVVESLNWGAAPGARARGVPEWKVLVKYGLAPVSGALLGYLGTQFGGLLAGAFVTEIVFDWNGLGSGIVEAVLQRDYPMVEAGVFTAAAACLVANSLGDWLQSRWEPCKDS